MSLILGLLGWSQAKLIAYCGGALAVLLVLFGFHRAGSRAQARAMEAKFLSRMRRDLEIKEGIGYEISSLDSGAATDRLRRDWQR